PEPFQRAFGTEELCAPSFAARWREVAEEQRGLLKTLGELKRPIELIRYLDRALGGAWNRLAEEYEGLHGRLNQLNRDLEEVRKERHALYAQIEVLKTRRQEAEKAKGDQFRSRIFEKSPSPEEIAERQRLSREVEQIIADVDEAK